jgi:hypothetical protein
LRKAYLFRRDNNKAVGQLIRKPRQQTIKGADFGGWSLIFQSEENNAAVRPLVLKDHAAKILIISDQDPVFSSSSVAPGASS